MRPTRGAAFLHNKEEPTGQGIQRQNSGWGGVLLAEKGGDMKKRRIPDLTIRGYPFHWASAKGRRF